MDLFKNWRRSVAAMTGHGYEGQGLQPRIRQSGGSSAKFGSRVVPVTAEAPLTTLNWRHALHAVRLQRGSAG